MEIMASISIQTRKVTELSELTNVLDSHYMLIHDGQRLRRVSARTIKQGLNTAPVLQNATSSTVGVVRPDNTTLTVSGGVLSAKVATVSQVGVVKPDGKTLQVDSAGVLSINTANVTTSIPTATSSTAGMVKPDNATTEIVNGQLRVKKATVSQVGAVKPDGATLTIDSNGLLKVNKSALGLRESNEIVSNKIINQNGKAEMKYWFGSKQQYDAIVTKDNNTIYDVYE